MLFILLLLSSEPSQGDGSRLVLKNGTGPCDGQPMVFHLGQWGYVGECGWSRETEKVVCRNAECGEPVASKTVLLPIGSQVWLNQLSCKGSEKKLSDCAFPGWGVSVYHKDTARRVSCSDKITFRLDGYKCAGTVKFSTKEGGSEGTICSEGWGKVEAELLCRSLNCGGAQEVPAPEWAGREEGLSGPQMKLSCSDVGKVDHLWQCVSRPQTVCKAPASVVCSGHRKLQLRANDSNVQGKGNNACRGQLETVESNKWIPANGASESCADSWCRQMNCGAGGNGGASRSGCKTQAAPSKDGSGLQLNCTDDVRVALKADGDGGDGCYGEVHVSVNGRSHPVCGSSWDQTDAEVLCRELKCGKVFQVSSVEPRAQMSGIMDYVSCSGSEASVWHCRAKRQDRPFSCRTQAHVVCSGSLSVRLADGLGKCAGRVEIRNQGRWQRVQQDGWTPQNSESVCKLLNCGKNRVSTADDKFSLGSGEFFQRAVNCTSTTNHIFDCIGADSSGRLGNAAAAVICEDHRFVFLKGETSCSGKVGIEQGDVTFWLSGNETTWNQEAANTVCRQMHCGNASDFGSSPSVDDNIWPESYVCSSNSTSLLDCPTGPQPLGYNHSVASVTCSGSVKVKLTGNCSGSVQVSVGDQTGYVCRDSWSASKAGMLCRNLGCGTVVQGSGDFGSDAVRDMTMMVKSLHTTKHTSNLSQSVLILGSGSPCSQRAYVVCSDSVSSRISTSRQRCSGNVDMHFDGKFSPVCMKALESSKTQENICSKINCGQPMKTLEHFGPRVSGPVISQLDCQSSSGKALEGCQIKAERTPCDLGGLKCTGWSSVELKSGGSCSGTVFIHSEGQRRAVPFAGWTEAEGQRLCKDLDCGRLISVKPDSNQAIANAAFWDGNFSCAGVKNPTSIWDCHWPVVSAQQQQQQLTIECKETPVTLSGPKGGEVKINGVSVCASKWDLAKSHRVCQEQHNCSQAVAFEKGSQADDRDYYHVHCQDYHHRLSQCQRVKGSCTEGPVSVYCVENIKLRTTAKCGGEVEVNYRNTWEKMCVTGLTTEQKEDLCRRIKCEGHDPSIKNKLKQGNYGTMMNCTREHKDVRFCISNQKCDKQLQAEIYCKGYVLKTTSPKKQNLTVPIILGLGIALIVLTVIVVLARVYCHSRVKTAFDLSSRTLERKDSEFGSSGFANEMDDFNQAGFRPGAEMASEDGGWSTSSRPYDDVDVPPEAQPLTSGSGTHQDVTRRSADGLTYEVTDPQEYYDDIEASGAELKPGQAEKVQDQDYLEQDREV